MTLPRPESAAHVRPAAPGDSARLAFAELGLRPGEAVHLESRAPLRRVPLSYLGCHGDQALMLTLPQRAGQPLALADDLQVTLRFVAGNYACACTTRVIRSVLAPLPTLFVRYPAQVEAVRIRAATRLPVDLVVSVDGGEALAGRRGWPCQARMRDLSLDGALLEHHDLLADVGQTLLITTRLPVADFEQLVLLEAEVRNLEEVEDARGYRVRHGVHFQAPDEETRLVLTAFVYQEMLYQLRAF